MAPSVRRDWVVGILGSLLLAVAAHQPVLGRNDWPYNHEFGAAFERTEQFRLAFEQGVPFPVWAPTSYQGLGSPVLLLYHRGFYVVSGLVALLMGAYHATITCMVLATALGVLGVFRLALWLNAGRLGGLLGGALLASSQYFMTDWLIRGAQAETFAMLVLPWVIYFGARWASGERVAGRWAFSIAALFHAHQVVAMFSLLPLVGFGILGVLTHASLRRWRVLGVELLKLVGLMLVLVLPWVLAIQALHPYFDLEITQRNAHPLAEYKALRLLWRDDAFAWGHQWRGYSVEVGRALVVAGVLGWGLALTNLRRTWRFFVVLTLALAWSVWLQSEWSRWLYVSYHWAGFLMFPWRMNTLLTLALVGAVVAGLAAVAQRRWASRAALVVMAGLLSVQLLRMFETLRVAYEWLTPAQLAGFIAQPDAGGGGEYLPRGRGVVARPFVLTSGCSVQPTEHPRFFTRHVLHVESNGPCIVEIGQFHTPLIQVEGAQRVETASSGVIRATVGAGSTELVLRVRTFAEIIGWYFRPPS